VDNMPNKGIFSSSKDKSVSWMIMMEDGCRKDECPVSLIHLSGVWPLGQYVSIVTAT